MSIKIAFANLKGGVGKTVSATAVASILEDRGYAVLLVDCDPQRNSTAVYGAKVDGAATMYDIIFSGYTARQCIQRTEFGEIIPNDEHLINCDGRLTPSPNMYKYLKKALIEVEREYDFIIFDTPPYRGVLLGNVLMSCDFVVVPLECELFGIQGLFDFYDTIQEFQEDNSSLRILGLLKVKYKKNQKLTKDLEENMLPKYASKMGTRVFKTTIRESVKCKEAIMLRTRLSVYALGSTVFIDYSAFVDEMLEEVCVRGRYK